MIRNNIQDWMCWSTFTGGAEVKHWGMLGEGFTSLDENTNAQTESKAYICDASQTTTTTGYERSFSFSTDFIWSKNAIRKIYNVARNGVVGEDAVVEYYRLEKFKGDQTNPPVAGTVEYIGRRFEVAIEVASMTGGGGEEIVISGNLNAQGDGEHGKLKIVNTGGSKTFTWTPIAFDESTEYDGEDEMENADEYIYDEFKGVTDFTEGE